MQKSSVALLFACYYSSSGAFTVRPLNNANVSSRYNPFILKSFASFLPFVHGASLPLNYLILFLLSASSKLKISTHDLGSRTRIWFLKETLHVKDLSWGINLCNRDKFLWEFDDY